MKQPALHVPPIAVLRPEPQYVPSSARPSLTVRWPACRPGRCWRGWQRRWRTWFRQSRSSGAARLAQLQGHKGGLAPSGTTG